ncbi:MAG: CPBP family intramembrane metalloprotease [Saprospiraceae bacterium]|nr:CPBP family intramembrane metalloprotease [Saprospiraceae bacterium]
MDKLLFSLLIQFLVITPLIILGINKPDSPWKKLWLFGLYYALYSCLLSLPNWFPELRLFPHTGWNWAGKILAISGSVLFYLTCAPFTPHNYVTLRQKTRRYSRILYLTLALYLAAVAYTWLFVNKADERFTRLLFQLTMPGLDEELAFRGIMLGLLANSLKTNIKLGAISMGNPGLIITSIMFGLVHAIQIDQQWSFQFSGFEFVNTFAIGLLLGWITIRSGSILVPVLIHNLLNSLPTLLFGMM